jgi:hypothetical protein
MAYVGNPDQDCHIPKSLTGIVHTDAALAKLHLACSVTQEKSRPITTDLAFDNAV